MSTRAYAHVYDLDADTFPTFTRGDDLGDGEIDAEELRGMVDDDFLREGFYELKDGSTAVYIGTEGPDDDD